MSDYDKVDLSVSFKVATDEGCSVVMPLLNYPGYVVTSEPDSKIEISENDDGLIEVTIPANFKGRVSVAYCASLLWTCATVVSIASLIVVALVLVRSGFGRKAARKPPCSEPLET